MPRPKPSTVNFYVSFMRQLSSLVCFSVHFSGNFLQHTNLRLRLSSLTPQVLRDLKREHYFQMSTFFFCLALSDICNIFKSQCQHKITLLHNILHDDFFLCYELQFCCMKCLLSILYFQFPFVSAPASTRLGDRSIAVCFQILQTADMTPPKKIISKHKFLLDLCWGDGRGATGFCTIFSLKTTS